MLRSDSLGKGNPLLLKDDEKVAELVIACLERAAQENYAINKLAADLAGSGYEELEDFQNPVPRELAAYALAHYYTGFLLEETQCHQVLADLLVPLCKRKDGFEGTVRQYCMSEENLDRIAAYMRKFFSPEHLDKRAMVKRLNLAVELARDHGTDPREVFRDEILYRKWVCANTTKEQLEKYLRAVFAQLVDLEDIRVNETIDGYIKAQLNRFFR